MARDALPRILSQLHGCSSPRPNQWQACCPVHKAGREANRSFGVQLRDDGSILLNCFAGCPAEQIRAKLGTTAHDLGPDAGRAAATTPPVEDDRPDPDEWFERCTQWAAALADDPDARRGLAGQLGVPVEALDHVPHLGVRPARSDAHPEGHREGACWTMPEFDAQGLIIGVSLRFRRDGKKKVAEGSHRGLAIPCGWKEWPGPLYLPEGWSDVIALTAAGCAAVGRFSVNGGVTMLAEWIRANVPTDRPLVWLGENDRDDSTGKWPGRDSSRPAAAVLADELPSYTLSFALPPNNLDKDVRKWMTGLVNDGAQWCHLADRLEKLLQPQEVKPKPPSESSPDETECDDRREAIEFAPGCDETLISDKIIESLAADPTLFVRAESVCRIIRAAVARNRGIKFPAGPKVDPVSAATLRERITHYVKFKGKRRGKTVTVPIPETVVNAVRDRKQWPALRHLNAVISYPFLRPDGTLVSESGYDDETGVYLDRIGSAPVLPKEFTRDAALVAWECLKEVVEDFPFAKNCHRSAWLTGLLTPLARFAFEGPTPMFLIDSNTPGTGKGLLAHIASLILTGQRFATTPYSHDDEEMRKKITTIAMKGSPQVLLDNINGMFGGSAMDIVLTSTVWEDRLLGSNTNVTFPMFTAFWGTGNNVQIAGDGLRRVNHIRMESEMARPEERTDFKHARLERWVLEHRSKLLGCALTILMAYFKAGRPEQVMGQWGSYEGWSDVVRAAVVWLGLTDPREGSKDMRGTSDPVEGAMEVLLTNWNLLDPARSGLTTNQVITKVFPPKTDTPTELEDIAGAITTMCSRVSSHALGVRFRTWRNRSVNGKRLVQVATHANTIRWGTEDAPESKSEAKVSKGDGEDGGDAPSPASQDDKDVSSHNSLMMPRRQSSEYPHHHHHPHQNGESKRSGTGFDYDDDD